MSLPAFLIWFRQLGGIVLASGRAWLRHRAQSRGAALAFYTLFSMAPILLLTMAMAGRLLGPFAARGEIFHQLKGLLNPHLAQAIQSLVLEAHLPGSGRTATPIAFLLLAFGATSVFAELKDSLDEIWQEQAPVPTGFLAILRTRLLAFALVMFLTTLFVASQVFNAILDLAEPMLPASFFPASLLSSLFAFASLICLFAALYKMLPEARISRRDALAGALFTAALFTVGRRLIGVYLGTMAPASSFGAAGSVAALLVWVYYSAQIFFLGAEFTREYALTFGSRKSRRHAPTQL